MGQPLVEATDLTKVYNGVTAVDKLNLRVEEGEIFGFLGPNGAGKTTSILMLLGLTEPTSGEARIGGYQTTTNPLQVKRVTGYLPENVGFYDDLTPRENLLHITRLNNIPDKEAEEKIKEALEAVGLAKEINQEVGTFSKGMKQRLGIADVMVKDPRLVILDEPTTGIDPAGVNQILDLIISMSRERGITIMLSSHLLHQVQKVCDRVGIIFQGRMVAQGSIDELGRAVEEGIQNVTEVQVTEAAPTLAQSLRSIAGVNGVEQTGSSFTITSKGDVRRDISRAVFESGGLPIEVKARDYGLEEIYMRYFREG